MNTNHLSISDEFITSSLLVFLFLTYNLSLFSQNVNIHAELVGDWQTKEQFSPEYHYNSVAVFLLNEEKLFSLFDPANLSKEERKKTGIKNFDSVESLYFHLEMPNPKQEKEVLSFPLYAFDVKPSEQFQSTRHQGMILDRITDDELNGQKLDAVARIEAITKNDFLELAYKISSNINKILVDGVFKKPDIWEVMHKAQQYFEDRYRGKIVAEFSVPILPSSEEYEYRIESASLYQVKWNFQEKTKVYKDNVWLDFKNSPSITEEQLKDKPMRLSKLKSSPYLMVVRYKSAYALPKDQQLNVALTPAYLDTRLHNLQEFQKESIPYVAEKQFLNCLREAISLKENVEAYQRAKDKGQANDDLLLQIAQQYYSVLSSHQSELAQFSPAAQTYYKETYEVSYFKLFKQIDHFLFGDQQVVAISTATNELIKSQKIDLDSLDKEARYAYLKTFQPYTTIVSETNQLKGDLFYTMRDQVIQLEKLLAQQLIEELPYSRADKIARLQMIQEQYEFCSYCMELAKEKETAIQQAITNDVRTKLTTLQSHQLKYERCFADIQQQLIKNIEEQFNNQEKGVHSIYQTIQEKVKTLQSTVTQFQTIGTLKISEMTAEQIDHSLKQYQTIVGNYSQTVCQLQYGGLLSKENISCLERNCTTAIP